MNIISNNCLGGYIYQNILHEEYKNPFIWTLFENPDDYINMIRNYNKINFDNIELTRKGHGFSNNLQLLIDNKYLLSFIHIFFDPTRNTTAYFEHTPRIVGENILTPEPWKYIVDKYKQRLSRMKKESSTIFLYFEPNLHCNILHDLPSICESLKYKCVIFTDDTSIKPNKYTLVLPTLGYKLPSQICNHYSSELSKICKPLSL